MKIQVCLKNYAKHDIFITYMFKTIAKKKKPKENIYFFIEEFEFGNSDCSYTF